MARSFKYVRIQGKELAENTLYAKGVFSMFMQMISDGVMEEEDKDLYMEIDDWFTKNLPYPPQCRNQEKVVCFFKTENTEMMMKMITPALWLLDKYHHPFYVVYTNYPGEIVYEDDFQVAVKVDENVEIQKLQESWSK